MQLDKLAWLEIIQICGPILAALTVFYFRIDSKIEKSIERSDQRFREEMEKSEKIRQEDRNHWQWLFEWAHKNIEELKERK